MRGRLKGPITMGTCTEFEKEKKANQNGIGSNGIVRFICKEYCHIGRERAESEKPETYIRHLVTLAHPSTDMLSTLPSSYIRRSIASYVPIFHSTIFYIIKKYHIKKKIDNVLL